MIKYIWQLPQNLLALAVIRAVDAKYHGIDVGGIRVYSGEFNFGVSLGDFILLDERIMNPKTLAHEYGHCIQSQRLGWLYLLVIGVPSATMNLLTQWKILKHENYYKRWPETWADKLGKVER